MIATVRPFELPLASPLGTARGTIDARNGFLFDVFGDPSGLGEACPIPPFTESREACRDVLERAADAYTETGWADAFREVSSTAGGTLQHPAARHAVSLASLDRRARVAYEPLYRYLGGDEAVDTVPINATIGDHPAAETASQAEDAAASGYPALSIKVGNRPVATDAARIRAVRSTVGSAVDIRLDANGAWSRAEAREFVELTEDLDIAYLEQPLDPGDFSGHRQLREEGVAVALDESVAMYPLSSLLASAAADVFVLKPMAVGGVDVARGMALRLRRAGHRVVVTTTIDGVVARTAAVHLAASLAIEEPCGLDTGRYLESDLASDPATIGDGTITLPDSPGLGIEDVEV